MQQILLAIGVLAGLGGGITVLLLIANRFLCNYGPCTIQINDEESFTIDGGVSLLDALYEKWKEGAFRYLMPDFRKRVHAGETFVIAGDRFAIGSSREMSPAGLKAVAEEVGLRMVIVCADNMGDIFRRNSLNLGLQVVQAPDAVADAQDGDEFTYDPVSRKLSNETRGKTYDPLPLTKKEDDIRRSGGIFVVGRREFVESARREPQIEWPDEATAANMTTTEQIVWAHRVHKDTAVEPGDQFV